ncbi:MAG: G1 family glutamic endopeptidase [Anaerolineae bacterium]
MPTETASRRAALKTPLWRALALALALALLATFGRTLSVAWASPAHDDPTTAAIQAVIQRANDEQQQAFAANDPTLMKDTAAGDYYNQMVQTNQGLARNGVKGIKLVKIEWGNVTLTGDTTATATTYETWQTTYADGTTDVNRDPNLYTLVLDGGAWKIQNDEHPDAASSAPGQAPAAPAGQTPPATRVNPNRTDVSHNWSGYAATDGEFTSVTGTWTVPQSDGTVRFGTAATWVGIGGVTSRDLIQAGTMETSSGGGSVQYSAWVETLPQSSRRVALAVSPGDSMTVSISETGTNQWLIAMKNNSTGATYQTNVTYASSHSSAEWVTEAPVSGRRIVPLDNFGTVTISAGSAVKDGETVTIAEAGGKPITMIDMYSNAIAIPSAIAQDGAGFSVTRNAAPTQLAPSQSVPPSARPSPNNGGGRSRPGRYPFTASQDNAGGWTPAHPLSAGWAWAW